MAMASTSSHGLAAHYLQYEMPDEVLLTIFSYLLEQDLCRLSLVCKRFNTIANDTELWKRLYQHVYEYDLPLFTPEPCKFVFVKPEDSDFNNPWKESFRQLYRGIHVRPGYQDRKYKGRSIVYFSTVQSALDYADERNNSVSAAAAASSSSGNNNNGSSSTSNSGGGNNNNNPGGGGGGGPSGANNANNNINNNNSHNNNNNSNLVSQLIQNINNNNNNSNQLLPAGYANGGAPAPAAGGAGPPALLQQQPQQPPPPTPMVLVQQQQQQQQQNANLPLNPGAGIVPVVVVGVVDPDVVMASAAASPSQVGQGVAVNVCGGGSANNVMVIEQQPQPPVSLIFLHQGHYRGEFLVIDSDVALIGAAPGNVAESILLERESESTVMFVEGAKHAYVGHMTLKFSPDVTSTVPHHKHYCLEVGENCSPTIDHCIIRSTSVGEWGDKGLLGRA